MKYIGYITEIDDDVDVGDLDFETTEYFDVEIAIVSDDRIRLEWTESDKLWATTIDHIYDNDDGEFGTGSLKCSYPSREGRRNINKRESGTVNASIIAEDDKLPYYKLDEFWIDVNWTAGSEAGRLAFELVRQ